MADHPRKRRPSGKRPGGSSQRPAAAREFADGQGGREPALDTERIVYGRHPVREAVRGRRQVRAVHGTDAALEDLAETVQQLRAESCPVHRVVDPAQLEALCGSREHQGVVAQVESYPYVTLEMLLDTAKRNGVAPLIFCLDQVTDPHNLGAIARVVDASGATGMLIPEHRSASVTAAAVKASAGALEHVLVARCTNLANEIERMKDGALWAYAATERGEVDYTDIDLAGGALLILGAEGPGVRPRVLSACDQQIRIPMAGGVASLNVATVSAVLAFEAVRQRRAAAQ